MLTNTVLRIIKRNNLLFPGETVVAAVSGGTDSLALLHILSSIRAQLKISLHIATFDHNLRAESAEDVQFVQDITAAWGLPITIGQADVTDLARGWNVGIELAARRARYAFLADTARQVGAKRVVVAHHADDQAETILMHILRGTGMQGLQGMSMVDPLPGAPELTLVRPLLTTTRAELEAYCDEHNLHPRQDTSNFDTNFLRNYIRLKALPFLKTFNPQVERALIRLADIASVEQDYLDREYERVAAPLVSPDDNRVYIDRQGFTALHPALQRLTIYRAALVLLPDVNSSYDLIVHAVEVGLNGDIGSVAQLVGGVQVRVDYKSLVLEQVKTPPPQSDEHLLLPPDVEILLSFPGVTPIPNAAWSLRIEPGNLDEQALAQLNIPTGSALMLRTRRPGDRIAPLGMGGSTQKVNRWMINRKIPRHLRDRTPLLIVNGEIAAILVGPAWQISQHFAVTGYSHTVFNIFVIYS